MTIEPIRETPICGREPNVAAPRETRPGDIADSFSRVAPRSSGTRSDNAISVASPVARNQVHEFEDRIKIETGNKS